MALTIGDIGASSTAGGRAMRRAAMAGSRLVLLAAVTGVFAATVRAENAAPSTVPKAELEAKVNYCENCHGVSARGFHGYYPIPRLAGQQPDYLENQLQAFIERRRTNPIMFSVGHVLSPAMVAALAATFKALDPKPLGGGPHELTAAGKTIYENGIPEAQVPACASCHGPEAKGDGQFPRLAGQLFDYVSNKLVNWDKERGQDPNKPDASSIMQPIAHNLTASQIKAVAAYLSYLE